MQRRDFLKNAVPAAAALTLVASPLAAQAQGTGLPLAAAPLAPQIPVLPGDVVPEAVVATPIEKVIQEALRAELDRVPTKGPMLDVNVAVAQIQEMLTKMMDVLGVPVPDFLVGPEDVLHVSREQAAKQLAASCQLSSTLALTGLDNDWKAEQRSLLEEARYQAEQQAEIQEEMQHDGWPPAAALDLKPQFDVKQPPLDWPSQSAIDEMKRLLELHNPTHPVNWLARGVPTPGFGVECETLRDMQLKAALFPDSVEGFPLYFSYRQSPRRKSSALGAPTAALLTELLNAAYQRDDAKIVRLFDDIGVDADVANGRLAIRTLGGELYPKNDCPFVAFDVENNPDYFERDRDHMRQVDRIAMAVDRVLRTSCLPPGGVKVTVTVDLPAQLDKIECHLVV